MANFRELVPLLPANIVVRREQLAEYKTTVGSNIINVVIPAVTKVLEHGPHLITLYLADLRHLDLRDLPLYSVHASITIYCIHHIARQSCEWRTLPSLLSSRKSRVILILVVLMANATLVDCLKAWSDKTKLSTLFLSLALTVGCFKACWTIARISSESTGAVPGPLIARLTPLWRRWHLWRGTLLQRVSELHKQHGALVRVAPYEFSVSDREMFAQTETRYPSAALSTESRCMDMTNIHSYERSIDMCTTALVNKLTNASNTDNTIDLDRIVECYTLDVLGAATVDQPFGFLSGSTTAFPLNPLANWKLLSVVFGTYFQCHPTLIECIRSMTSGGHKNFRTSLEKHITEQLHRRSAGDGRSIEEAKRAQVMSDAHKLAEACLAATLSGVEPISQVISSSLLCLWINPKALQELRYEVEKTRYDKPVPACLIVNSSGKNFNWKMPYLMAVLLETLRTLPPSTASARNVLEEKTKIAGYEFPPGVAFTAATTIIHSEEKVYSTDEDVWRPERWLKKDLRETEKMVDHLVP
ncbi:hypothetical protein LTR66_015440, partial [Elasticomyces elasticus]